MYKIRAYNIDFSYGDSSDFENDTHIYVANNRLILAIKVFYCKIFFDYIEITKNKI